MSPKIKENAAKAMGQMVAQSVASGLMCWCRYQRIGRIIEAATMRTPRTSRSLAPVFVLSASLSYTVRLS